MSFDLSKIEYIDIHSHLQFQSNEGDRSEVIKRMKENNIATICISTDTKESKLAKSLAEENENIFYSIGLHPADNKEEFYFASENSEEYFSKLKNFFGEKCLCIGECGLDYFYLYKDLEAGKIRKEEFESEIEKQKKVFREQIKLSIELNIPLMLHVRPSELDKNKEDAYLDSIDILKNYENLKGNFHFFVGTKNILKKILEELPNFSVSIPAVCTFTNEYDEMIKSIPLDKIHIETDSPFVMPKSRRKEAKRNEPSFVISVFEKICEIKEVENMEEFKKKLKENFKKMFLK